MRHGADLERTSWLPIGSPFAQGPVEVLSYAKALAGLGTHASCRIAWVLCDNAIELSLRELVTVANDKGGPRQRASEKFGELLTQAATVFRDRSFDPSRLRRFHATRNQLYHESPELSPSREHLLEFISQTDTLLYLLFGEASKSRSDQPFVQLPDRAPAGLAVQYVEAANLVRIRAKEHPDIPVRILVPSPVWMLLDEIAETICADLADVPLDDAAMRWLYEHFLEAEEPETVDEVLYWLEEAARIFGLLGL